MRTTVTLDDDLVDALKQRANERGLPFKQVLNEAVRAGLNSSAAAKPYRTKPGKLRLRKDVDLRKALQLAGMLEDEEAVRKLRQGR
jgi:hypothetical protein